MLRNDRKCIPVFPNIHSGQQGFLSTYRNLCQSEEKPPKPRFPFWNRSLPKQQSQSVFFASQEIISPSRCLSKMTPSWDHFYLFAQVTWYLDNFNSVELVGVRMIVTHWGRVPHICVRDLTIIGLDNGLSPGRRQAIIWTNAGILLIRPPGTNLNEILIEIHIISFKEIHLKMSSGKWRPFCLGLNVLKGWFSNWLYRIVARALSVNFIKGNVTEHHMCEVNIGSLDGSVPSSNKPLPEPILTQNYIAIWCHYATKS